MAASVSRFNVANAMQLESSVSSYIAQGYVVANRTPNSATMLKRKEFSVLWAVVGFFLCLLPFLIYCIVYATQQDQMVEIFVGGPALTAGPTMSPDGRWWWDGSAWQDAATSCPPTASRSPDGNYWWDGTAWRAMPMAKLSAPTPPSQPPDPPLFP
jgi:hypothetical protein